jgi:hypothetical protein
MKGCHKLGCNPHPVCVPIVVVSTSTTEPSPSPSAPASTVTVNNIESVPSNTARLVQKLDETFKFVTHETKSEICPK